MFTFLRKTNKGERAARLTSLFRSNQTVTSITRPDERKAFRITSTLAIIFLAGAAVLGPGSLFAQSSAAQPAFNATVQGQSASTIEGTFANVVNYVGNVICPIGAALMVPATFMQMKAGRSWAPTAITGVGLLAVSGVTRYMESAVQNGQSAVK
jgi:hypothetical protein